MELSWKLFGWTRLRLTSADCASRLRTISREMPIENIRFPDEVTVEFDVARGNAEKIRLRDGEKLEIIEERGIPQLFRFLSRWKLVTAVVLLLGILTLYLPTRIWFIRVDGNGEIPERLILEEAENCGLYFGASRREARSEQVKNYLLYAIPELRWAGVNTEGCIATITVSIRDPEEDVDEFIPGDLVAVRDAVISEVYPHSGSVLAAPGQAVREGQVLISGYTDTGFSTNVDRAEGEVYGLTRREISAVLPSETVLRTETGEVKRYFSLLIGKKRVNFSNDSGILHGTCVKMRTVNYLTLPGGFQLPAALVTETCCLCETENTVRAGEEDVLLDAARGYAQEQMTAGTILKESTSFDGNRLDAVFECREMIGAFRPGAFLEGETNDRENSERGAG